MPRAAEIRTQDPDLGCTIALWVSDLLDQFHRKSPSGTVVIDDGGLAGRPVRNGFLNWAEDFRASRENDAVRLTCSSSSIMFRGRAPAELGRKALVRIGLATDATPLDHSQVVRQQQRIRRVAARVLDVTSPSEPCAFLLRVDDFPSPFAGIEEFGRFHRIAVEHGVPYLLAVTPFLGLAKESSPLPASAVDVLRTCVSEGAELALHGFSHRSRYRNYASELLGLPAAALRAELQRADEYLCANRLETVGFVAPYNAYDPLTIGVLAERFPLICGGPESVVTLGYRAGPSFLMQSLYVPSYRGAYDIETNRLARFDRLIARAGGLTIPVTLHWANEARDGFRRFRALCERLQGRTKKWSGYVEAAGGLRSLHRPR